MGIFEYLLSESECEDDECYFYNNIIDKNITGILNSDGAECDIIPHPSIFELSNKKKGKIITKLIKN